MSSISISEASRNLSHWINRATYGRECVVLTSRGKPKAVILGIDAFEDLIGIGNHAQRDLVPLDQLRSRLRQALANAGYMSREGIIELVREVKREMIEERKRAMAEAD